MRHADKQALMEWLAGLKAPVEPEQVVEFARRRAGIESGARQREAHKERRREREYLQRDFLEYVRRPSEQWGGMPLSVGFMADCVSDERDGCDAARYRLNRIVGRIPVRLMPTITTGWEREYLAHRRRTRCVTNRIG